MLAAVIGKRSTCGLVLGRRSDHGGVRRERRGE